MPRSQIAEPNAEQFRPQIEKNRISFLHTEEEEEDGAGKEMQGNKESEEKKIQIY